MGFIIGIEAGVGFQTGVRVEVRLLDGTEIEFWDRNSDQSRVSILRSGGRGPRLSFGTGAGDMIGFQYRGRGQVLGWGPRFSLRTGAGVRVEFWYPSQDQVSRWGVGWGGFWG